jgi:hypothetical protein
VSKWRLLADHKSELKEEELQIHNRSQYMYKAEETITILYINKVRATERAINAKT